MGAACDFTDKTVCDQLRPSAVSVTLPAHLLLSAVAYYRSISLAGGALSSKPYARRCCCQSMEQTLDILCVQCQ